MKYAMRTYTRFQFAIGMAFGWVVIGNLIFGTAAFVLNEAYTISDQWLLALGGIFFSLWWIPRERGRPLEPSEYERGYVDGYYDAKEKK